jgi:hypothetical protein
MNRLHSTTINYCCFHRPRNFWYQLFPGHMLCDFAHEAGDHAAHFYFLSGNICDNLLSDNFFFSF